MTAAVLRQRNVAITTWHVAYRKKTFIFSHGDTYHHTLMDEPVETWLNIPWTSGMERRIVAYLNSRWHGTDDWIHFHRNAVFESEAFAKETGVDLSKPSIGMLTNVMWDAQLHYPANAFHNMLEWALHTIRQFEKRPNLQLVIRVHPAETTGTIPSRQTQHVRADAALQRRHHLRHQNWCRADIHGNSRNRCRRGVDS